MIDIKWNEQGLIPAIVQDANTGQVLMLAYMNAESLRRTLESGQAWFWSRSRQELWHKGATSGNFLNVKAILKDLHDSGQFVTLPEPSYAGLVPIVKNSRKLKPFKDAGVLARTKRDAALKLSIALLSMMRTATIWRMPRSVSEGTKCQ